jgi:hypothetical protein
MKTNLLTHLNLLLRKVLNKIHYQNCLTKLVYLFLPGGDDTVLYRDFPSINFLVFLIIVFSKPICREKLFWSNFPKKTKKLKNIKHEPKRPNNGIGLYHPFITHKIDIPTKYVSMTPIKHDIGDIFHYFGLVPFNPILITIHNRSPTLYTSNRRCHREL